MKTHELKSFSAIFCSQLIEIFLLFKNEQSRAKGLYASLEKTTNKSDENTV